MLVTTMEHDMHLGRYPLLSSPILFSSRALPDARPACVVCRVGNDRILVGRVRSGSVTTGDQLHGLSREAKELEKSKVLKVLGRRGLERSPIERGECGDIIGIAGFGACSGTSTSTRPE